MRFRLNHLLFFHIHDVGIRTQSNVLTNVSCSLSTMKPFLFGTAQCCLFEEEYLLLLKYLQVKSLSRKIPFVECEF